MPMFERLAIDDGRLPLKQLRCRRISLASFNELIHNIDPDNELVRTLRYNKFVKEPMDEGTLPHKPFTSTFRLVS